MKIFLNETDILKALKFLKTVSSALLKFFGILFLVSLVLLIIYDVVNFNELIRVLADRSMVISFWSGTVLLILDNYLETKIGHLEGDEFSDALNCITNVSEQLERLREFLDGTQVSIVETRKSLDKMEKDQNILEPLVNTNREIVNTILAAHSNYQNKREWKRIVLSFCLGIVTSFLATMLYEKFI